MGMRHRSQQSRTFGLGELKEVDVEVTLPHEKGMIAKKGVQGDQRLIVKATEFGARKQHEERERFLKQMLEDEAKVEKSGKDLPEIQNRAILRAVLSAAERAEVFKLNPDPLPRKPGEAEKGFHGYEILAEINLKAAEDRKKVIEFISKKLHWNEQRKAFCFNPRHGLRIAINKETWDLVICFECNTLRTYIGGKHDRVFVLDFVEGNTPLDDVLGKK